MLQEVTAEIEGMCGDMLNELHTILPAQVTAVNVSEGTIDAQPIGSFYVDEEDEEAMEYPEIADVPIMFPCLAKDYGIVFPIKKGDTVLLLISEVELDAFLDDAESVGSLRYDLSNAIAMPGLMRKIPSGFKKAVDSNAVVINNKTTEIVIKSSGIEIKAPTIKVTGDLTVTGNVKANGVGLATHTHVAPKDGGTTTTGQG